MTTLLHNMPIARKVTVVILVTCMAALIITGLALFAVQVESFRRTFVGDLSAVSAIIAKNEGAAVIGNDRRRAFEILRALEAKSTVTYASVRLNNGSVFVSYGIAPTTAEAEQTSKLKGLDFAGDELVLMQPIIEEGRQIGMLQVRSAYRAELRRLTFLYGAILVGVLTVAILLAFLISKGLRRSISDPILQLAETARMVAERNDYSVRAQELEFNNELGIFTDSFNKMLAQIEAQNLALEASRDELERKVEDRTRELSSSNHDLQRELEERQRAEREAKEARIEADRANQAKSEFLSRMSHELRTPMNAILGFGQLLEIDFDARESQGAECSRDFAQERHSVDQILKGGTHLLELMNEVLDLSAIEAGRLSVSCEPIRLDEVVQETIELIRPLTRERKIALNSEWDAGEVEFAFADRQRIKQVLLNLLSNAIKYNRDGGSVSISRAKAVVSACEEGAESGGHLIRIDIADTGRGISPEDQQRLFEPFQRLSAEHTAIEGTGLGLSLSKRMVELMGGTLTISSAVGQGSTFSIELLSASAPTGRSADFDGRALWDDVADVPRRLLFVEDNLPNLHLIERILAHRPEIKIVPAIQGRIAIESALEHKPDVVLLDLNLPDMHGREVLSRLQSEPSTRDVPVVVISADAKRGQRDRLLAEGAFAYLSKPLDVREFVETIHRALNPNPVPAI